MKNFILLKNKNNIEKIEYSNTSESKNLILKNIYFDLYTLPSQSEIDSYNNKNNTNLQLEEIKEKISEIDTQLPLYDAINQNIYLINAAKVYDYIIENNYRLPNEKIYNILNEVYKKTKNEVVKNKIKKNLNFLELYNFDKLYDTYLHVIYINSNQIGKNITYCKRSSYLPYLNQSPYYSRSEIINMALNLKIIKPDYTYYDLEKLDNLCLELYNNDINNKTILSHQLYIQSKKAQHIIHYYTFYGSMFYNRYLRNDFEFDPIIDNNIKRLYELINESPAFENDHYVYRFVNNDDYLQHVQVGGIYNEKSFISTTRNPFYEPKNHVFGYILIKIKLPKNKKGIGLCLETYSLFPNEQEILLLPAKLKLINIDSDFKYYHTDINAQRAINKKYEFEYIEPLEIDSKPNYNKEFIYNLPQNFSLISTDIDDKIIEFYRSVPILNDMHYFKYKNYIFQIFYLEKIIAYYKYYFLLQMNNETEYNKSKELIFIVLQDEKTQEINLIIEIGNILSVNYLHRFTGAETIDNDDLFDIIQYFSKLFNINDTIIHPKYKRFESKYNIEDINNVIKNDFFDYIEDDFMKLSADLKFFNYDIFNYIFSNQIRFKENFIINNMNLFSLDRLKRLEPSLVLNIEDNDEIYKIYKKNRDKLKGDNVRDFMVFLNENYFYLIPVFLNKLSKIININPFNRGFYLFNINNIESNIIIIEKRFKDKNENNRLGERGIEKGKRE